MPPRSYLRRAAYRAVPDAPGLVPPRRVTRALSPSVSDETPLAAAPRSHVPANELPPLAAPRPPTAPNEPSPHPAQHVDPPRDLPTVVTPVAVSAPATPILPSPAVRPRADFVFDSPRRTLPSTRTATDDTPAANVQTESPRIETETGTRPTAPARAAAVPRSVGAFAPGARPDPLAAALAAAVRWTASDPAAMIPSRPPRAVEIPPATAASAVDISGRPAPAAGSPRQAAVAPAFPAPARVAAIPQPSILPRAMVSPSQPVAAVTTHASAAAVERFTGIHIGSVQVEILPPPVPLTSPPAAPPAVPRATPASQLARGLTSSIGLRQS